MQKPRMLGNITCSDRIKALASGWVVMGTVKGSKMQPVEALTKEKAKKN